MEDGNSSPKERGKSLKNYDYGINQVGRHPDKITEAIPESISEKLYNSIVQIVLTNSLNQEIYGTGFFMRISINNTDMKCLFTCKHLISDEDINNNRIIYLFYGKENEEEKREIKLDKKRRFIKTFYEDVTLIEIIKDDKISENKYLTPDLNYENGYNNYRDKNIYLAGYPNTYNERCISSGSIVSISEFEFGHKLFTKPGSSGSPICNEKGDVIGIHTSNNEQQNINYGSFIGKILDKLKNIIKANVYRNYKLYICRNLY